MRPRGFTLLELLVVLGLMGATAATLAAQLPSQAGTEVETRVALRRTLEAIYGNGSGAGGFLGDVGRLPALEELVGRGDLPAAQRAQGIAAGWSGPYLESLPTDGWSRPLRLDPDGRLRSAGANGIFDDEDDLVAPAAPPLPRGNLGSLCVEVLLGKRALTAGEASVQIFSPDFSGSPAWVAASSRPDCAFFFAAAPAGKRLVMASGAGLSGFSAAVVPRGGSAAARIALDAAR
ncbi:MAG: prepilin-type N-terminal cleavage/methylation domain-containing protein [Deltaproteobacteria bacterium]|nr:MAG: prepilin-type N-terminal cleavage/methylation domain-containing protein [Deltaproteobacteria bacterium]